MAYIPWPSDYVNMDVLADGYSPISVPNIIRSEMDWGPEKFRRRSALQIQRHDITLRFDRVHKIGLTGYTEFEHFQNFVNVSLLGGVVNTVFNVPPSFEPTLCRFYTKSSGESMYKVSKYFGDYVFVQFVLEEIP